MSSGREHLPTEVPLEGPRSRGTNSEWAEVDLRESLTKRMFPQARQQLRDSLERARRVDAGIETDPNAIQMEFVRALERNASPSYLTRLQEQYRVAEAAKKAKPPIGESGGSSEDSSPKRSTFRQAIVVTGLLAPAWLSFLLVRSEH